MNDITNDGKIKIEGYQSLGFNRDLSKPETIVVPPKKPETTTFTDVIRFKNLDKEPQGNEEGKTYYDPINKKLKIWIDEVGQWAEIPFTTTSTSTTSSSTTSTSISTTSTSTSTTSTSTTSTSTTTI